MLFIRGQQQPSLVGMPAVRVCGNNFKSPLVSLELITENLHCIRPEGIVICFPQFTGFNLKSKIIS